MTEKIDQEKVLTALREYLEGQDLTVNSVKIEPQEDVAKWNVFAQFLQKGNKNTFDEWTVMEVIPVTLILAARTNADLGREVGRRMVFTYRGTTDD